MKPNKAMGRTKRSPLISVIMPTYNNATYLEESIGSVLGQTVGDLELLVIDDCSTDTTSALLDTIDDSRLRVLVMPENSGPAKCRNAGLDAATGRYIALMDSDDISLPERFAVQHAFMEEYPEITVCGGAMERFGGINDTLTLFADHDHMKANILFDSPLSNPVVMFRGDFLRVNAIRYREDLRTCSDYAMWLRLMHDYPECLFINLSTVLARYRVHGNNVSQATSPTWRKNVAEARRPYLERFLDGLVNEEATVHEMIFNQRYARTREELVAAKTWLTRLCKANSRKGYYVEKLFRIYMAERFLRFCSASLHLGPWVVTRLTEYPDFPLLGVSSATMRRMLDISSNSFATAAQME